jgi:ribosomal protein S18 acetylase RimI-like enzyme
MGAPPCTIRPARPADISALRAMKWQLALAEGAPHTVNATEADWHRDLFGRVPRFSAFLAEFGGTAAGMMILNERFFPGWAHPILHVSDLFVVPECRRRGAGRALLARAAQEAIKRRASFVELNVREDNPARRLYRKASFERVRNCAAYVLAGPALYQLADLAETVVGLIG